MINWQKVRDLRDEVGEDGLAEVIELFLEEVELVLSLLGRPERNLAEDMHFLKGCAANLGFHYLAQLCARAETEASTANDTARDMIITGIRGAYHASRMAFLSQIGTGLEAG